MKFTIIDPPLPTLARFRALRAYGASKTILRQMEYELIARLELSGRVLDFGGGAEAEYMHLLPQQLDLRSVNIDEEFRPTDIVAPGMTLPFDDESFDAVITFNTLEHVEDDAAALEELARVLQPGGEIHIVVPFLYPVHGHPDDYNRHTPSWYERRFARMGFAELAVSPLTFGRSTAARLVRGRGDASLRRMGDTMAALRDIGLARLQFRGETSYSGRRGARVWAASPGWYLHAVK